MKMELRNPPEDNFKKMVNIMSDKYSRTLSINSKESDFTINFQDSIKLDQNLNYELGLLWFCAYNTIFNITKDNNKFTIQTRDGHKPEIITIEPGAYEIKDLNDILSKKTNEGIKIKMDIPTSKCIMTLENIGIHFQNNSFFRTILGFTRNHYITPVVENITSENIIKIINTNTINIHCDCITGSYNNGKQTNVLYSFPSNTVPMGYKIVERMNPPNYLPLCRKYIMDINFKILNQEGELIDFNGEEISMYLHLKQV